MKRIRNSIEVDSSIFLDLVATLEGLTFNCFTRKQLQEALSWIVGALKIEKLWKEPPFIWELEILDSQEQYMPVLLMHFYNRQQGKVAWKYKSPLELEKTIEIKYLGEPIQVEGTNVD